MPAKTGPSSCSAVRPILPSPSARSVPRCRWLWPIALRVCLILTFATLCLLWFLLGFRCRSFGHRFWRLFLWLLADRQDLADGQAARGGDLFGPAQALQAVDRRLQHVDRVRRAEALGEDVPDAAELEDGADPAAGDDAGSLARRA